MNKHVDSSGVPVPHPNIGQTSSGNHIRFDSKRRNFTYRFTSHKLNAQHHITSTVHRAEKKNWNMTRTVAILWPGHVGICDCLFICGIWWLPFNKAYKIEVEKKQNKQKHDPCIPCFNDTAIKHHPETLLLLRVSVIRPWHHELTRSFGPKKWEVLDIRLIEVVEGLLGYIPMTDPWCCYINGVPWIPSIYPNVSIYTSTMDPMGYIWIYNILYVWTMINPWLPWPPKCQPAMNSLEHKQR